jgi:hypothetical protein
MENEVKIAQNRKAIFQNIKAIFENKKNVLSDRYGYSIKSKRKRANYRYILIKPPDD